MLRRPVGLLPTVTARAVTAPEATGHMADAVVQAKDVAQERALAVPLQVWQPVASLPVLSTVELAAQTVSQLVREAALPFALSHEVSEARPTLPWAQASACASFGVTVHSEQVIQRVQERTQVVEAARAKTLARKQVSHFKCLCCRAMVPKADGRKCTKCGYTQPERSQLAISAREEERAACRSNTKQGRRRNAKRGANVPQHSLSVAPVGAFEAAWQAQLAEKKQRIEEETSELCGLGYVETEDARAAVLQGRSCTLVGRTCGQCNCRGRAVELELHILRIVVIRW